MIEKIFENSLKRLRNGEQQILIVRDCPARYRVELERALTMAAALQNVERISVPPAMKRKAYLLVPATHTSHFSEFFNSMKVFGFAAAAAFIVIIGGLYTAYGALSSLPGDRLFGLKIAFQDAQLQLAKTPESRTELQIQIANQSLLDAQQVLSQPNVGPEEKQQAVNEVATQTANTLQNLQQTVNSSSVASNTSIINNVKTLAANTAQLIANTNSNTASATQAPALSQTLAALNKVIATVNDQQTASNISTATVTVSGVFKPIDKGQFTLDGVTYEKTPSTIVKDQSGNLVQFETLQANDVVSVKTSPSSAPVSADAATVSSTTADSTAASSTANTNAAPNPIADEIDVVTVPAQTPAVPVLQPSAPTTTPAAPAAATSATTTTTPDSSAPAAPATVAPTAAPSTAAESAAPTAKPLDTYGGFIVETRTGN